jgi:hypothetical protein
MKTKSLQERGQALILIAIILMALLAILGLAVDGSAAFSDRRHAQNAADTAALAGALAKVNGDTSWALTARDRATANGYGDLVNSTVEVHNPPTSGIYANCSDVHFTCTDYVEVIITSNVKLFFGGIFGFDQIHNRVESVASAIGENIPSNLNSNGIVALSQSGCAVITGGNGTLNLTGGGIFSNATGTCAFRCNGNTLALNVPSITTVGGIDANGCSLSVTPTTGAKQIPFPPLYDELAEPSQCSGSLIPVNDPSITITGSGSNKTAELQPGHYSNLPLSNQWKNMILNPGVYCIDTTLDVSDSLTMKSGVTAGVLLYFKPSSVSTIIPITGTPYINIWGINSDNDPSLSAYTGFLMYFAPNYSLSSAQTCKINGNSASIFTGTIYAPYCNIVIGGTAGMTMKSQLLGYTVDLAGNPGVVLDYASAPHTTWRIPRQVGLSK